MSISRQNTISVITNMKFQKNSILQFENMVIWVYSLKIKTTLSSLPQILLSTDDVARHNWVHNESGIMLMTLG